MENKGSEVNVAVAGSTHCDVTRPVTNKPQPIQLTFNKLCFVTSVFSET